jgi:hypothetical protein
MCNLRPTADKDSFVMEAHTIAHLVFGKRPIDRLTHRLARRLIMRDFVNVPHTKRVQFDRSYSKLIWIDVIVRSNASVGR